ncbi:hypothetical protein B0H19DRAFT_1134643 [Mycena capillaripes]|nr:hypothetical protein B0H19DRAFT_1134643 [Mycena capillaripes]
MPSAVHTIDVNSPLVKYAGPWNLGGADGDPETNRNNQGTFVFCAGTQCSATISFTGTEVHVVGAFRSNSGPYQVDLDGQVFGPFGTEPPVVEQFQTDLFNQTNLVPGAHVLTISVLTPTVATAPNMDLDYFTWTSEVNSLTDVRVQDDAPAFVYDPPTAWAAFKDNLQALPGFDGGGHGTVQSGATATFSFAGDRVGLYGSIGSQGGPYSVHIDNGSLSTSTTKQTISDPNTPLANYLAQQLLFYADGLGAGNHTVTVTSNLVSSGTQDLNLDYAVVDGTLNAGAIGPLNASNPDQSASTSTTTLAPAEIGGIVAAVVVLVCCLVGALVYILNLRRRQRRNATPTAAPTQEQGQRSYQQFDVNTIHISNSALVSSVSNAGPSSLTAPMPFLTPVRPPRPEKSIYNDLEPPRYDSVENENGRGAYAV